MIVAAGGLAWFLAGVVACVAVQVPISSWVWRRAHQEIRQSGERLRGVLDDLPRKQRG